MRNFRYMRFEILLTLSPSAKVQLDIEVCRLCLVQRGLKMSLMEKGGFNKTVSSLFLSIRGESSVDSEQFNGIKLGCKD